MGRCRSRSRNTTPRTIVTSYNPVDRESYSITVYSGDTVRVARDGAEHLARTFHTTKLNDGRHKRRL